MVDNNQPASGEKKQNIFFPDKKILQSYCCFLDYAPTFHIQDKKVHYLIFTLRVFTIYLNYTRTDERILHLPTKTIHLKP